MISIQDMEVLLEMQTEMGIKRGIADIAAERFNEFTPKYAQDLATRFKQRLKNR